MSEFRQVIYEVVFTEVLQILEKTIGTQLRCKRSFMAFTVDSHPRVWPGILTGSGSWLITSRGRCGERAI